MSEGLVIVDSARKHGVDDDDILHAYRKPIRVVIEDDGLTMVYGADLAGRMLEVGFVRGRDDAAVVIVHAMRARMTP